MSLLTHHEVGQYTFLMVGSIDYITAQWATAQMVWAQLYHGARKETARAHSLVGPLFLGGALFCSAACRAFSIRAPSSSVSVPLEMSASSSMLLLLSEAALAGDDRPMCRVGRLTGAFPLGPPALGPVRKKQATTSLSVQK